MTHKFTPKIGDEFVKNGRRIFIRHERDGGYDVALYHADIDHTKDSDGDGVPDGAIGMFHITRRNLLRDLEGAERVSPLNADGWRRCPDCNKLTRLSLCDLCGAGEPECEPQEGALP